MKRLLSGFALSVLVVGCAAPAHRSTQLASAVTPAVPATAAKQAATLGQAACVAWRGLSHATDVAGANALQRTAEAKATAAARLDPHWSPLADDLSGLRTLEAAYAKADVYHAYPLRPKLDALRKRIC